MYWGIHTEEDALLIPYLCLALPHTKYLKPIGFGCPTTHGTAVKCIQKITGCGGDLNLPKVTKCWRQTFQHTWYATCILQILWFARLWTLDVLSAPDLSDIAEPAPISDMSGEFVECASTCPHLNQSKNPWSHTITTIYEKPARRLHKLPVPQCWRPTSICLN